VKKLEAVGIPYTIQVGKLERNPALRRTRCIIMTHTWRFVMKTCS